MGPKKAQSKSTPPSVEVDNSTSMDNTSPIRRSSGGSIRESILMTSNSHSGSSFINPTDEGYEAVYQARLRDANETAAAAPPLPLDSSSSNGNSNSLDQNATIDHHMEGLQADTPVEIFQ
jgi:hypothetical protein